ncbi:Sucrase/ferredoxin-like-domain-containing protein [Mycena belliarum]|uniref:Sucrase/ferredoxin-like-domain-containing protein n=1 Tax=Mycena belliarum TaxID=1033014 RepID=A0AAD6XU64_9AGAR|nr:Sucrase/ferredoxin-like-domain-containing protein [Mycena belliae]
MIGLRKLKAWVLRHELDPENIRAQLSASAVPVSTAGCRTCADPCEEGHGDYPGRFTVDMETQMLGSVSPFRRQILICTGKTDWDMEITWAGGLAGLISSTYSKTRSVSSHQPNGTQVPPITGIFDPSEFSELSILNGNHKSICDENLETVLVFPDFMVVSGIPPTREGAQMFRDVLDPNLPRMLGSAEAGSTLKTWVLPYSCVITFCSHKRRDKRCGISAPKLESAFTEALQRQGWSVDTQLEHIIDPPLEKFSGTAEEKDAHILQSLKTLRTGKKVLLSYNSHMGGHQYAGNCIIYIPGGSSVWYGRVSPHEVESIVTNTIEAGLVLPELLRGGVNLSKPGCRSLHDW